MFKPLRKKRVVKFTMWILIITFVIWGAGSAIISTRNYAGIIFGKKISIQEYNRGYAAVLTRSKMVYGDDLPKLEKFLNLKQQAWDRLILKHEAKRNFIGASNREVIEKIASIPFFQRNGVFDKAMYGYMVENLFQTPPREFEESVRDDIIIEKLLNSLTKDITTTDQETKQAYRDENELADVSYILIRSKDFRDKVGIKDEELISFYNEHKEDFKSPVMVNVTYIRIPFDEKKEEAKDLVEEMMALIRRGHSLENISKSYKISLKETGDFSILSKIPEIGLSYPFALAALQLSKKGQVSDIVETNDSFCIMRLKSKKPQSIMSFEDVETKVKEAFITEKSSLLAKADAEKLLLRIKTEAKTLEDLAKELDLALSVAKQISKNSFSRDAELSDSSAELIFSLKAGETGGPAKTKTGYAVVRLDDIKPFSEEEFQKQREPLAKALLEKKRQEIFKKWFLRLKAKADLRENL